MATQGIKQLTDAQKIKGWSLKLREDGSPKDVFGYKRGVYRDGQMPSDAFLVRDVASNGQSKKTISLLKDLVDEGRYGSESVLGFEEKQTTKEFDIYADEIKHGVAGEKYGKAAFEKEPYKFFPAINQQLSKWHSYMDGLRIRQALCLGKDSKLVGTKSQNGLSAANQYIHPNVFVNGAAVSSQPVYSATENTFVDRITASANGSIADITLDYLSTVSEWAESKYIGGITGLANKAMWILTVPPRQATKLRQELRDVLQYDDAAKAIAGALGTFENLILVEDSLNPRLTTTTGGTDTATFSFKRGTVDGRATPAAVTSGAGVFDVGYLLGAAALIEYSMEEAHYEMEKQDYNRIVGVAALKTNGYNRCDWDLVSGTNADTRENFSSGLVLFPSVKPS